MAGPSRLINSERNQTMNQEVFEQVAEFAKSAYKYEG